MKEQVVADPVEVGSDAETQLSEAFGDHTFYADATGLFVLEPADESPAENAESGHVIQIAAWANEQKDTLKSIDPKASGVVISLVPGQPPKASA